MANKMWLIAVLTLAGGGATWTWAQEAAEADAPAERNGATQEVAEPAGVPEPSIVPRSWDLELQAQALRPILVQAPNGVHEPFWYMPYKVINNTGDERQFVPEFVMATDEGDILDAGVGVPPHVFEAIKKKLGNPLLESPNEVIGRLLQGSDFAKESVAIWRHPGHDIDQVQIFASGFSGETVRIANPVTRDSVVLRKTWMQSFELPGTVESIDRATVLPGATTWVMR